MADGERLLGPGDGHIAQPPLFFHLFPIANGAHAGEQAVFKAHQEHMGEFQTLGRVHGHHDHRIVPLVVLLNVGIEGDFFQESGQGGNIASVDGVLHIGVDAGF